MRKLSFALLILAGLALTLSGVSMADEAAKGETKQVVKHEYVGAGKCKTCHKDKHASWAETGHAKAFSKLSAEEQKKPECTKCHITGALADGTVIENVECEACHGPGADYKSPKIMSKKKWAADPEAHKKMAIEAGLVYPTEATCVRCHTKEGNANFKPFDFEKRKGEVHPAKAEVEKAKTEG
ncbi:MAG: multiheme c-type cytochrome [bacterium]